MASRLPKGPKPEAAIQRTILDYLAAERVLAFRMNTGAVKTESRFFRFGVPGMADILAFKPTDYLIECALNEASPAGPWDAKMFRLAHVIWIEVKAEWGQQSALQKSFQKQVEEAGHRYVLAKSLEDVKAALG